MSDLTDIVPAIRVRRKELGLTQHQLAAEARISRALLAELESGKLPEIGYKKLVRIMNAVGLDLRITTLNARRPTLEDLLGDDEKEPSR